MMNFDRRRVIKAGRCTALIAAVAAIVCGQSVANAQSLCSASNTWRGVTPIYWQMDALQKELVGNRAVGLSTLYLTAQQSFTAQVIGFLDRTLAKVVVTPEDQASYASVMTALKTGNAGLELSNLILNYWRVAAPVRIGSFYATFNQADKAHTLPSAMWRLSVPDERLLRVYVIPTNSGGTIATPSAVAEDLAKLVKVSVPKRLQFLATQFAQAAVKQALNKGFETIGNVLASLNENVYGPWLISKATTFPIPGSIFNSKALEIGSIDVVCLERQTPPTILAERIDHERMIFRAAGTGDTTILIEPRAVFADAFYGSMKSTWRMFIHVDQPQSEQPSAQPFVVQLPLPPSAVTGALLSSKIPSPLPFSPTPPLPPLPPAPEPPKLPPIPHYTLCDGGDGSRNPTMQTCDIAH